MIYNFKEAAKPKNLHKNKKPLTFEYTKRLVKGIQKSLNSS